MVTLRDPDGNPVPGVAVSLSAAGGPATIAPASVTSSAAGEAAFTFRSNEIGTRQLTAAAGPASIGPVSIAVVAGPPVASQTTADVPDGRRFRETRITVESRDAFGNRVPTGGATVTGAGTGVGSCRRLGTGVGAQTSLRRRAPISAPVPAPVSV